jgi:hypothetical protein
MKSLLASLVVAGVCLAGSTASAAVFVDAGPVNVAVGRPVARVYPLYRPVAVRPVCRPVVVRPVVRTPVVVTPVHYHWYHRWHWHHW